MATTMQHPTVENLTREVPDDEVDNWAAQGWKRATKTANGDKSARSRKSE